LHPDSLRQPAFARASRLDAHHVAGLQLLRTHPLPAVLDHGTAVVANLLAPCVVTAIGDADDLCTRVDETHRPAQVSAVVAAAVAVANIAHDLDLTRPQLTVRTNHIDVDPVTTLQPGDRLFPTLVEQPGVAVEAHGDLGPAVAVTIVGTQHDPAVARVAVLHGAEPALAVVAVVAAAVSVAIAISGATAIAADASGQQQGSKGEGQPAQYGERTRLAPIRESGFPVDIHDDCAPHVLAAASFAAGERTVIG